MAALALLGVGEAAPGNFPVEISIEGHAAALTISIDGQQHELASAIGPGWQGVALEQPGPLEREYQVDGSDTTSSGDRQPQVMLPLFDSALYRVDAWLRDESGYSRWQRVQVTDLATHQELLSGAGSLPTDFRIVAELQRPEAPARLWLLGPSDETGVEPASSRREGLELDRDRRNARWLIQQGATTNALPRWFFPEQPAPFAAELLQLLGRSAAAAFSLGLAAMLLNRLLGSSTSRRAQSLPDVVRTLTDRAQSNGPIGPGVDLADCVLAMWLVAAGLVATLEFHQLPHILDAISYTFQAGVFASGQLAGAAPSLVNAFHGPFEAVWQGRIFSQYPPGAPLAYALGDVVHLEWLVGPLACLALIGATSWTAGALFGRGCGLAALVLGALSPFVLFQAGSFLSHPIAGGALACALASFVAGERGQVGQGDARAGRQDWYALSGALLGVGFVTREAASVLFALPLGVQLLATRRWRSLTLLVAGGVPFVLLYLLYNANLTGNPLLLPRTIFDPSDHFGFGDGIGFHTRHTLAAGLANTDELLTLLQFDLFGWPPLFAFGLIGVPFLFGRVQAWDLLAACGVLAFVLAYTGYFYHGIALGPRYYFEAMPWLLLLASRGAQELSRLARSRLAASIALGLLCLNTLVFYLPAELHRRADFSALPGNRTVVLDFVQSSLLGPRLSGVPSHALVVTDDWWLYNAALAALNCPRLPDCDVVFGLATNVRDLSSLRAQFADRRVLRTRDDAGHITLVPSSAAE